MCEGCEADTFALRLSLFNVFVGVVLRDVRHKMQAPSRCTFQFSFNLFIYLFYIYMFLLNNISEA
jgi:hypothetical protein